MRTVRECTPRLQAGKRHIKILVRAPDGEVREIPEFHRHPAAVFRAADGRAADGQSLGHYRIGRKKLTRNMQPAAVERQTAALCGQHNALVGNNTRQRVRSLELDEIIRDFLVLLPAQRIGIVAADLIIHRAAAVVARDVLLEERAAVEREAKRTGEVPRIHSFGILALRERKFRTGAAHLLRLPLQITAEAMLRDLKGRAAHRVGLVLEAADNREQNRRVALPRRRIASPDIFRSCRFASEAGQLRTERVDLRAEAFVFEYDHDFSSSLLVSMRKRRKVWYSAPFRFTC